MKKTHPSLYNILGIADFSSIETVEKAFLEFCNNYQQDDSGKKENAMLI